MTGTELATLVRKYTGTTSTTYTNANLLVDAINAKNELGLAVEKRNPQYFVLPATKNLVASSNTYTSREYSWPDDILSKMVSLEVAFVSESPLKYIPVNPYPGGYQQALQDAGGLTEARIIAAFSNSAPYYFLTRKGYYILSGTIVAVTSGLRLKYKAFPADLANLAGTTGLHIDPTTTSFGIPLQLHELWARRTSMLFKTQRPNPLPLSQLELNYENDLEKALASIGRDDDAGEIFGGLPDHYDNGFNL